MDWMTHACIRQTSFKNKKLRCRRCCCCCICTPYDEDDIHALNDTLAKIVDSGEYINMQRRLASVWPFFYYHSKNDDMWKEAGGKDVPGLFGPCQRGPSLQGDFETRWPKQTAAGVRAAKAAAAAAAPADDNDGAAAWPGPEEWGDGGATDFPGAIGGLMAVLHNRLVTAGELPESRRLPRQPY